jgi:hypothetical protein
MDWSQASLPVSRRILSDSETYLSGTVAIATAADQRAAMIGGTFVTAATAIVAGLIALASTSSQAASLGAVYAGGSVAALLFAAAAGLCIRTMMPADFCLPGTAPENWIEDVASNAPLKKALADLIGHMQDSIVKNEGVIRKNARLFKIGAWLGIAAPVVGTVVWAGVFAGQYLC